MTAVTVSDAALSEHMPLVHHVVRSMCFRRDRYDDMVQSGVVGLWRALERYRAELGAFAAYAVRYIRGYILNDLRSQRTPPMCGLEVAEAALPARGRSPQQVLEDAETLERALQGLEPEAWAAAQEGAESSCYRPGCGLGSLSYERVAALHVPGATTAGIAQACGVTQPTLSRWRKANRFVEHWICLSDLASKRRLGRLEYAQAMALHVPGAETASIAEAAGVHPSSVSRWRFDVGLVPTWTQTANPLQAVA